MGLKKKYNLWRGVEVHHKGYDKDSLLYDTLQHKSSRHVTNLLPHPTTWKKTWHYVTVPRVCNLALRCATVKNIWIQLVQSSEDNLKTQKFKNYTRKNWDLHLRSVLNNVPVCD